MVVRDLITGPKRFRDLTASLSGISSRTLTKKLQFLEAHAIVDRHAFNERPPRVEYTLTEKGRKLNDLITAMREYGEKYL